jgi:hypothetical protein
MAIDRLDRLDSRFAFGGDIQLSLVCDLWITYAVELRVDCTEIVFDHVA